MSRFQTSDLWFAFRSMSRRPGFALVILVTMAISIGATTAVFSVVESVLLRPLPYPDADRLVIPRTKDRERPLTYNTTYPEFLQWRQEGVFDSVATFAHFAADLTGDGAPERVPAMLIGDGYFRTVRMDAVLGRVFRAQEHQPGGGELALISEQLWQRRYGGDPEILGRTIRVADLPRVIVGVVPAEASSPLAADVWLPFQPDTSDPDIMDWDNHAYTAVGRLEDGESLRSTNAKLAALAARAEAEHPDLRSGETIVALSMTRYFAGADLSRTLWILLCAVCFVLLMGCINIANLLLSRASRRSRELAVRSALGASRLRLVRQLLTESLLLAPVGGILGIEVARLLVKVLVSLAPAGIPRIGDVTINLPVLGFAFASSFVAALLFGAAPALRVASLQGAAAVHGGAWRTTTGRGERRGRNVLIGLQLALSLSLLGGAGYTILGLENLQSSDLGFEHGALVHVPVSLPRARYEPGEPVRTFYERVVREVSTLPGVESATVRSTVPLGGGGFYLNRSYLPEGRPEPPQGVEISGPWTVVGPDHFRTMGIPLLRGRDLLATDDADSPPVMVVNQRFAQEMFGEEDPLGKRVRSWRDENVYREIVGVVGNERYYGVGDRIRPCVYVPHRQESWRAMSLVVRAAGSPTGLIPQLRGAVSRLDPDLVVAGIATMDEVFASDLEGPRFVTILLITFAAMALFQAAVGIYGVLSYLVSLRTREIGIRLAVGARRSDVLRMVAGESFRVVAVAVVVGLVGVIAIGRILRGLLFEVSAVEPGVILVVTLILAGVALLASLVPAGRAARVDPATALSVE